MFEDPHYAARENIISVLDPDFGAVRMQGVVPKFSRTPGRVTHPGLHPGAHNAEVYIEMLGLTVDEFEELRHLHVI